MVVAVEQKNSTKLKNSIKDRVETNKKYLFLVELNQKTHKKLLQPLTTKKAQWDGSCQKLFFLKIKRVVERLLSKELYRKRLYTKLKTHQFT